jgi:hypothetical protein
MCFNIHPDYPDAIVAKKDIKVYKLLENVRKENGRLFSGTSPYREYGWLQECIERAELEIDYNRSSEGEIHAGLHAYTTEFGASKLMRHDRSICEFTIPKGATYYINPEEEEIVADAMIWKKPDSKFSKFLKRIWDDFKNFEYN